MRVLRSLLVLSLGAILAVPGFAQGTNVAFGGLRGDPSLPVEIVADSLNVNQTDGTALLIGSVVISQGEMKLSADQVFVVYNTGVAGIQRLEAEGNVLLVNGTDAAEAQRADYSIDTGIVTMTGDVLLMQGPAAITGDRMQVNLIDGTAQITGRVRTVLQPIRD